MTPDLSRRREPIRIVPACRHEECTERVPASHAIGSPRRRDLFDLLSESELVILLAIDPDFRLPSSTVNPRERIAAARSAPFNLSRLSTAEVAICIGEQSSFAEAVSVDRLDEVHRLIRKDREQVKPVSPRREVA